MEPKSIFNKTFSELTVKDGVKIIVVASVAKFSLDVAGEVTMRFLKPYVKMLNVKINEKVEKEKFIRDNERRMSN